jgi:hypothetical protein
LVEYIILLVAVATLLVAILVEYGGSVDGEWRLANEDSVWQDVENSLSEDGAADAPECPHYYNSATGRWHDSESHLFVSFADAEAAGC